MADPVTARSGRVRRWSAGVWVAALVAITLTMLLVAGGSTTLSAGYVVATSGALALLWVAAAGGLGWPLRRWLLPRAPATVQLALGVAALLALDSALGRLGWLAIAGGAGAWIAIAAGVALLAVQCRHLVRRPPPPAPPWWLLAVAPAVAVGLLATASAPGWLWGSEFGGYDALSYHLQLPKEWLALGRMRGLTHNVYSHLPSSMEAGYYHLAVLAGDGIASATACQCLHAVLAVATALACGRIAERIVGRDGGMLATGLVLATPWVLVVGTLAYDEMAVALMLAGGLLVLQEDAAPSRSRGLALGLLAGAAVGAKLTAIGFVAVPLVALLAATEGAPARLASAVVGFCAAAVVPLLPWLIANAVDTGNPLFPFAAAVFGSGHWSAEQVAIWRHGHQPDLDLPSRFASIWHELIRYGVGPRPHPTEPWQPQWSILPWLTVLAALIGGARAGVRGSTMRLCTVLAIQIVFWAAFTHVKSRFMVPAVVPAAVLVATVAITLLRDPSSGSETGRSAVRGRRLPRPAGVILFLFLFLYACLPVGIFVREAGGRPTAAVGGVSTFTGDVLATALARDDLRPAERDELLELASPVFWLNHRLDASARVLAVGEAAPLYYRAPPTLVYRTTWDRGPLSRVMDVADAPGAWVEALRSEGFTHLLVNPTMVRVWEESGWNDPRISLDRVRRLVASAELERSFADGKAVYRIGEPGAGGGDDTGSATRREPERR